jgi:tetratricopeptide (TPR) repeat protein
MALVDATAIDHHGLVLDSLLTMGIALTQAGRDGEALQAYDRAIGLATTFGEMINQRKARLERSELLLFSIGELESASNEAGIADLLSQRSGDLSLRVEPLALAAIIQARNGRPDRAEKIFCEAAIILDKCPLDTLVLERTMLALAAAMMLESRKDLAGMRERYAEAEVLASGTAHPEYWIAVVKMQYGGSLKRQKRPMEARPILEDAAQRFDHLRNPVQSARARRAADVSDTNTSLD